MAENNIPDTNLYPNLDEIRNYEIKDDDCDVHTENVPTYSTKKDEYYHDTDAEDDVVDKACKYFDDFLKIVDENGYDRLSLKSREKLSNIHDKIKNVSHKEDEKQVKVPSKRINKSKFVNKGAIPKPGKIESNSDSDESNTEITDPDDSETEISIAEKSRNKYKNNQKKQERNKASTAVEEEIRSVDGNLFAQLLERLDTRKVPRMEKFNENDEDLEEYLNRFEKHCENNIKGGKEGWLRELEDQLTGDTLENFKSCEKKSNKSYDKLKTKLLELYMDTREIRKRKAKDEFHSMKMRYDEQLYLFSNRLELQFRSAYPSYTDAKIEKSRTLRDKFIESVPTNVSDILNKEVLGEKVKGEVMKWSSIQKYARVMDVDLKTKAKKKEDKPKEKIIINVQNENPQTNDQQLQNDDVNKRKNDHYYSNGNNQNRSNMYNNNYPNNSFNRNQGNMNNRNGNYNNRSANMNQSGRENYNSDRNYNQGNMNNRNGNYNNRSANMNQSGRENYSSDRNYNQNVRGNGRRPFNLQSPPVIDKCLTCFRIGHTNENCRIRLNLCITCGEKDHNKFNCPLNEGKFNNNQRNIRKSFAKPDQSNC